MQAAEIVLRVVEALNRRGVAYMLVGSFSSNLHGIPRMTNDADFVVELGDGKHVSAVASDLLPDLVLDPQMRIETITGNLRYVITHRTSPFKVELFLLSGDAHHKVRFARRRQHLLDGHEVWFQTAEDVVIQKLRWYARAKREKDLADVIDVLDAQEGQLDTAYLRKWCDEHGTSEVLDQAMAAAQDR